MQISQDSVPSTIAAAVDAIVVSIDETEREFIRSESRSHLAVHHTVGRYIRNAWSLWDPDSPIKRDAIATYRIAHADDISGLILSWVAAKVRDEEFNPFAECERFHQHWASCDMTSLEAGGVTE